ncbi:MAG: hypothetical protein IJS13_02030 [Paludibacteraceae bacterium]|nr:hypothetical protein [Paludibacteraceae bacterium]
MKRFFTLVLFTTTLVASALAVTVNDVAGTFKGSLNIGGTNYPNKKVYILPGEANGTITFVLPDFIYNSASLGDIVLVNIPMDATGRLTLDNSTLYIKAISERATVSVLNGLVDGSVTYNSVVSNSSAQVLLSIAAPSLPEPILVLFTGNKVTSDNYAITNGGFEGSWSNKEPQGWHSFSSATGTFASMAGGDDQFKQSSDKRPGSTGSQSVMLASNMIAGVKANGNCTNGQINAGSMSADDASGNYNFSDPSNSGYNTPFVGNPDSLVFWAKYIPADKNPSNSVNQARAHAVVTTAARYQDPENTSYASVKIADAAINYSATSSMGWQRLSAPFSYTSLDPSGAAYILVTFTTNYQPGGGSTYSTGGLFNKTVYPDNLYLDDVEMIYNHSLTSLKMNGASVSFSGGHATTQNVFSDSDYSFVVTNNGKGAKSFVGYDVPNNKVCVYVVGDNYSQNNSSYSLYTLQMAEPVKDTEFAYSATTCSGELYSDNLFNGLKDAGTYNKTIPNTQGGDSLVTLTLTVLPAYSDTTRSVICEGDTYLWCGKTYENLAPGLHTDTVKLSTIAGCDSLQVLQLQVLPAWRSEEKRYVNEANLDWHGKHIQDLPVSTEPYLFYDSLTAANGCDSIYILRLFVSSIPVTYGAYNAIICEGEDITFDGVTYKEAFEGDIHIAEQNCYGGDSVVHLTVTVLPSYTIDEYDTIIVGDTRTWEGWNLSNLPVGNRMLYASYYSINDCDSTLVLHLTVQQMPVTVALDDHNVSDAHVVKIIRNGHLYIIRRDDEAMYNVLGIKIKNRQ